MAVVFVIVLIVLVVVLVFVIVVVAFALAGKVVNAFVGVHLSSLAEARERGKREEGERVR